MTDLVVCNIGAFAGPAAADRLRVRPLVRLPTTVTAFVEDGRTKGDCKWYE
jgi:hypothetical protein